MFRKATARAQQFTRPVILSRRTVGGKCSSMIGAFMVVNEEGWIITANHILEFLGKMYEEVDDTKKLIADRKQIENNSGLGRGEKKRRLKEIRRPHHQATEHCSAWWAMDGLELEYGVGNTIVDFGLGRFKKFDPNWIKEYPTFKDPTKNFEPGTSLCKLGFPFHQIEPAWNAEHARFELPVGAVPLPYFPIDGIFTRTEEIIVVSEGKENQHYWRVETSSPGLKGQSGGPTYDINGVVWALQCQTRHLPLGFDPVAPGQSKRKEHQFLNVGLGVHPKSMFEMFNKHGVKFAISDY